MLTEQKKKISERSLEIWKNFCVRRKRIERGKKKKIIDKKKYCEEKKLFLTASHVLRILLATENYFWIQESFFVYI